LYGRRRRRLWPAVAKVSGIDEARVKWVSIEPAVRSFVELNLEFCVCGAWESAAVSAA